MLGALTRKPVVQAAATTAVDVADIRAERDMSNLEGLSCKITPTKPGKFREFRVVVKPPQGSIWHGGEFHFRINIPDEYPTAAPTVRYIGPTRLWHPNIEGDADKTEWGVCLNILRKSWTPVMGLKEIGFGLEMMFFEPVPEDPLPGTARLAAQQMHDDPKGFERKTQQWMRGIYS
jgi:ubiquitin-protein ligase